MCSFCDTVAAVRCVDCDIFACKKCAGPLGHEVVTGKRGHSVTPPRDEEVRKGRRVVNLVDGDDGALDDSQPATQPVKGLEARDAILLQCK